MNAYECLQKIENGINEFYLCTSYDTYKMHFDGFGNMIVFRLSDGVECHVSPEMEESEDWHL